MNQKVVLDRINTLLSRFQEEVKIANKNGEFSINIHSENVLLKVLNVAYGFDLHNVNYEEGKTFPAIDLRDTERRVAFQITSTGTVDKAVHTLRQCVKKGLDREFDHLYIYFLKGKEENVSIENKRIIVEKGAFDLRRIHFLDHAGFYTYLNQRNDMSLYGEIRKLLEEQFADPYEPEKKTISTQGSFIIDHPFEFFGREGKIKEILGYIDENKKTIVVSGEGGIGKTELCREVLSKIREKGMHFTAVNLRGCRTFDDMIRRIAGQYEIAVSPDEDEDHIEKSVIGKAEGILYLDNFEDIMSGKIAKRNAEPDEVMSGNSAFVEIKPNHAVSSEKIPSEQRRRAMSFLRACRNKNFLTVMISSRYKPDTDFTVMETELDVLDADSAVRLFIMLSGGRVDLVVSPDVRDFVVKDLHCYPLSVVLTALHKKKYKYSILQLRGRWKTQFRRVRVRDMENERHMSLATALLMTYEEIREKENDRALWELFTLFPNKIDCDVAENLTDGYDDALEDLVDIGIIHLGEGELSVQPTLRDYILQTDEYAADIETISQKLLEHYMNVYGKHGERKWGTEESFFAAKCLKDALFFMDWLVEEERGDAVGKIHRMIRCYYQEAVGDAVITVRKAIALPALGGGYVKANLLEYCGDLEMRTAKLEEAKVHYREAESLYRQLKDDLGLANVLHGMGDLERRTDKLEEAGEHYREAGELYRQLKDDLGLANVLHGMGELERRTDKLKEAEDHYREAETLYRQIHADLGLANALKAMGDLEMRTVKFEEAEKHYQEAESLYRRIHADLGLANVLKAIGDFGIRFGKLEEAGEHYREAESLYRRVHADLGLANVLLAIGDLEMRAAKQAEAEEHYREAESLYRRVHADVGLANVLQAMGDLEVHTAKLAEAEEHYREAESLYRRIHADLGLASVLQAMGDLEMRTAKLEAESLYRRIHADLGISNVLQAIGDLEMRTAKLEEAEKHYREAESLYRRIHDDLGLANVLQSMGNLLQEKGRYYDAINTYGNAADLYKNTRGMSGLSYTVSEMCFCYAKTGDIALAVHYAEMANKLCDSMPYEKVKEYCMNKVISALKLMIPDMG